MTESDTFIRARTLHPDVDGITWGLPSTTGELGVNVTAIHEALNALGYKEIHLTTIDQLDETKPEPVSGDEDLLTIALPTPEQLAYGVESSGQKLPPKLLKKLGELAGRKDIQDLRQIPLPDF